MTLESTHEQRAGLQGLKPGKLVLVQFLVIEDQTAFKPYLFASEQTVKAQGGQRTHAVYVDQMLAGGGMP